MTASGQLLVQHIQHQIRQQGRERPAFPVGPRGPHSPAGRGVPSSLDPTSPSTSAPAVRKPRTSRRIRRSATRLAIKGQEAFDPIHEMDRARRPWRQSHQDVVVHPIEEFLQIEIDDPAMPVRDMLLRPSHRLMRGSAGTKAIARVREGRVPSRLKHLKDRLLNEAVEHTQWGCGDPTPRKGGMPRARVPPPAFGISTRSTGCGR